MPEVITIGEALIDFVPTVSGTTLAEAPAFVKAAGGAPANVAVGLARLGVASGFIGKVGDDPFGRFLADTLAAAGVDLSCLRFTREARTALAFVALQSDGERDFTFYRHPSADMLLTPEEIDLDYVRGAHLLHFGSIGLIGEPSRSATLRAVETALEAGAMVSYDPNLRLALWPDADPERARAGLWEGWRRARIVKASREEVVFLAGSGDLVGAVARLWHPELELLVVTEGREGCRYFGRGFAGAASGWVVEAIDTTGAGDAFVAALLAGVIALPGLLAEPKEVARLCSFANAAGALATTRRGAIPALPATTEVEALMASTAAGSSAPTLTNGG